MSAPAISASSSLGRRSRRAVVDDDPQPGRETRRLGRPVADDRRRGDDERGAVARRAREVGEHGRGLAEPHVERQASAELGGVEEADPRQRLGLVGAQLADEALGLGDRRTSTRRRRGARCRWPSCCRGRRTPPASPDPSRPMLWRRISAPVSCVTAPRSASAAAACSRSTRSTSTQRPRDCTSGRAWRASRATSAAVSSTSSNSTDQATLLSWCAPTTEPAGRLGEQSQRRRRLAPRQRRHSHVEPDRRERGADDGHELPCLVLAQRHLSAAAHAGPIERGEQPVEARPTRRRRVGRRASVRSAASIGTSLPLADGASTDTSHTPPESGGVELHDELRTRRRRDRARPLVEPSSTCRSRARPVARNGEPSIRAITVSARSVAVFALGGARRQLHALDALGHDRLDHGGDHRGRRGPAVAAADARRPCPASPPRAPRSPGCRRAPAPNARRHRPAGPAGVRARGGWARSTHGRRAERPRARRGRARARWRRHPSRPWPPLTATSQPSASFIGIASASARMPPGSGDARMQSASPPAAHRSPPVGPTARRSTSGGAPRPAAHTTT